MKRVELSRYRNENSGYQPTQPFWIRSLWHLVNHLIIRNYLNPSSAIRATFLRFFGAKIGKRVILRPGIRVKFPWNLEIGDYAWIGEDVWLDTYAKVSIGSNACISQGTFLTTGNHDWTDSTFPIRISPTAVEDGSWIGAKCIIGPGVRIANHCVITAGSVVTGNTAPYVIYAGNPASPIKERRIA